MNQSELPFRMDNILSDVNDCAFCNKSFYYPVGGVPINRFHYPRGFEYHKCPHCESYTLLNRTHHYKEEIYPVDYYTKIGLTRPLTYLQKKWAEHSYGKFSPLGFLCSLLMGTKHRSVQYFGELEIKKGSRILDFGCGNGQLMKMLYHLGYDTLSGVDPMTVPDDFRSNNYALLYRNLDTIYGDFHVIISCHSIEHVPNPDKTLAWMASKLKHGGTLIIQCPIAPNIIIDKYGPDWVGWDAPRHLTIPSQGVLQRILAENGVYLHAVYDESTLWSWQASDDNLWKLVKQPEWRKKLRHLWGRYSPSKHARNLRLAYNQTKKNPGMLDCRGFVFKKGIPSKLTS